MTRNIIRRHVLHAAIPAPVGMLAVYKPSDTEKDRSPITHAVAFIGIGPWFEREYVNGFPQGPWAAEDIEDFGREESTRQAVAYVGWETGFGPASDADAFLFTWQPGDEPLPKTLDEEAK